MSRDSSPLFCRSSPPLHLSQDPEDAVVVLLEKARRAHTLSPAVENFLKSHQSTFFGLFSRQIELIKSRSQDFRDAEITVFDKTLLTLTEHPDCLMNPATVNFFCEEYLNINLGGPISEMTLTLRQTVEVPEVLKQALPSSSDPATVEPEADLEPKKPSHLSPINVDLGKNMEPKLAGLWSVYETARTDYLDALKKNIREKIVSTAKFLRDTAENILLFLENKNADALLIAELEGTFTHAKTTVVCLTGGRNRKFDKAEVDKLIGVPRGPSRRVNGHPYPNPVDIVSRHGGAPVITNGPVVTDRYTAYDLRNRVRYEPPFRQDLGPYGYQSTRDRRDSYGVERSSYAMTGPEPVRYRRYSDFGNPVRQQSRQLSPDVEYRRGSDHRREDRSASPEPPGRDSYRSGRSRTRSPNGRYYRPTFRDRAVDHRDGQGRGQLKAPMHGRGHSGIPYGYDGERMVDSYRPSRGRENLDHDNMDEGEF
ncbi:hypothetical protein H2200_012620 [Cladophialophora chaetospira]|uniref:Uncharacterized protein n=1 Tax=Cladophialophora chaetospira TaxID=386627 RepID=A0AA39CC60_9EURO|nr:hypothetical protein H2200_012620 [Cladophialophora chaetospira]